MASGGTGTLYPRNLRVKTRPGKQSAAKSLRQSQAETRRKKSLVLNLWKEITLEDVKRCCDEVSLADYEKIVPTKVGSVRLFVNADRKESTVLLTSVHFTSSLACNIVSYEKLDENGYALM
uniref:Uncharacterized protein n=1 Tax=Peronospora matthiolae TaxID=2874970 RepID=A0AAV1T9Z8_9STRA